MTNEERIEFISKVLSNMPSDWLRLTTHRLDIYNEQLAKVEFLEKFEKLALDQTDLKNELKNLPTAFDYIRLGHPLSCVLEWVIAKSKNISSERVISFSSQIMPVLAVLRANLLAGKKTRITFQDEMPLSLDTETLKNIYGYQFEIQKESELEGGFSGTTISLVTLTDVIEGKKESTADFVIAVDSELGSLTLVNDKESEKYISAIQHVRRRESIAMTPDDSLKVLRQITGESKRVDSFNSHSVNKEKTLKTISEITNTKKPAAIGSCGLSVQYAIMMGLVHSARDVHKGRKIKFIVPPNCYGGTNDQARRVAACVEDVEVVDLPVDGGQNMVQSVEKVLEFVAGQDAIPYIIAEIPTNPRVEVPDLEKLREALSKKRKTKSGSDAVPPVFILDQTFCPNKKFLGGEDVLSTVETISYVSGSKFPSGGLCTAGYCVANEKAEKYLDYIENHLKLCANEATGLQIETLAEQMPSMLQRIEAAYNNTREFVTFIQEKLPKAKINFVSDELAKAGFTPSVFSLDLPTIGETHAQREVYKRDLNHKLIEMMIHAIPDESKHCVSYGQLKGCYWTIPATSTQGTTREGDKDYIVRVSVAPDFDLEKHKKAFAEFSENLA